MTRYSLALAALAACLFSSHAATAWAQAADQIEPYTGPPVYLEETTESVPASVVGNTVDRVKYDNDQLRIERGLTKYSDNSMVSNGPYREFYRDGQQFVDGQFSNGDPVGEWTYWHPNGQLAKKVTYQQGQPDGQIEARRADGTLESRRSFAAGKRNGVWETYADDGETRLTEAAYEAGKPAGVWKWWYANGSPQREMPFVEGKADGLATEWAESGAKRAEISFSNGKRHGLSTQWTADGREIKQQYAEGKPVE